ncbi:MAG: hypothetical protein AAFO09_01980, partial [Pseudomonadota bacterium]
MTLEINQASFRTSLYDEEQNAHHHEAYFTVDNQTASLTIEESDSATPSSLSLQGIPLQGRTWDGELHLDMNLSLPGYTTNLSSQEQVWLSPYLTPDIRLSWENYHSQRPITENTLSVLVRPNPGQPLHADWMDAHLLPTLNAYYSPTLEQLYTDRQVAQQVRELVQDTLPTAPAGYTWVRASHYQQLQIQLSATDWEQTLHQPQTLDPDEVDWNWVNTDTDTTEEAQQTIALANEPDLFIGLDTTDLDALRAPYAEGESYAPQSPAMLWRANDFSVQLATLEEHEYGAFVPQAAWDFFEDDVNIDWQHEKDRRHHGGSENEKKDDQSGKSLGKRSYSQSFRMHSSGGDDGDDGDDNN